MKQDKEKRSLSKKDIFIFIIFIILTVFIAQASMKTIMSFTNAVKTVFDSYPTISVAVITGLLAFISAIVGKFMENWYTIKNQIRKERQEMYINFLDWLIRNVFYDEISNNENAVDEIREQQKNMTLYASDKVLKAWASLKDVMMNDTINNDKVSKEEQVKYYIEEAAPYIENLILEIRKELGYKNKNIKQYDILKLYINDLNKYLKNKVIN